jgi:hypothetical protein
MYEFTVAFVSALLVGLAVTSGVLMRRRRRRRWKRPAPTVDDEAIRKIMDQGTLETDEEEPLDLGAIEEEERRFWSENWDEPEEL